MASKCAFFLANIINYVMIFMFEGDCMECLKQDSKKLGVLFIGFIIMATGIVLLLDSGLGLFPWGVLHQGLSNVVPLKFGEITAYLGFIILVFSVIAFKTNIGPGTVLNIVVVGPVIDLIDSFININSTNVFINIVVFLFGLLLMTMGKSLYISTKLGAGPRDGLFVGVSRTFNVEVKYIKPIIEIIVLSIGFALGGTVGVGTVVAMLTSGYLVQMFFKLFRFESRTDRQRNFVDYFRQTKSA